jgi:phosphinothricin acetyltransferase
MITPPDLVIRDAAMADASAVADIYNGYITTTTISFETEPVGSEAMATRMAEVAERGHPWLVAELAGRVVGYAYAIQFHPRAAYYRTAETTIYLAPSATGQGIGKALYQDLLSRVRALGFHTAVATIALPNDVSVGFHESCGFTAVGRLPEVGRKFDRWIDLGYWHLMLD